MCDILFFKYCGIPKQAESFPTRYILISNIFFRVNKVLQVLLVLEEFQACLDPQGNGDLSGVLGNLVQLVMLATRV